MKIRTIPVPSYRTPKVAVLIAIAVCLAMSVASPSAMAQGVTIDDLLGYWKLNETDEEADVLDSSLNAQDGYFDGFIDPTVEGPPGFATAAYFDGETAQVAIDPIDPIGFGELTNNFTVMAWINPEQFDHKGRIFGGSPTGGGWGFGTTGDSLEITTFGVKDYDQPVPLELATWTHVAVALDADNAAHFYVNGEFVGTQTHDAPGNPTDNPYFIGASCCATEFFEGRIDEVAVYQGVLSEQQMQKAALLSAVSIDAPDINPDGLRFQLDFATVAGATPGWDIIDEIDALAECDYLGDAATPCTVFELTDQAGADNDVTLEILEQPFIGNWTPNDTVDPWVYDGTAVPPSAIGDYQYRDPDTAGSSAPFRFSNLDPGTYSVTVFEGRSNDGNGQFAKLWVGDANGSNEPGVAGEHEGQNTGDFAAGSATLELTVGEGEYLWYRHLEDNSGGISGLIIRGGTVDPGDDCNPNTGGDLDGNGLVDFADFLVLSGNFGETFDPADHTKGDIDCNQIVEFADFLVLSGNFGTEVGGAESVPEPTGLALLAMAGLAIGTLRRRR